MMISTHCDTNMDGMSGLVLQLITAPVICVSLVFFTCKLHLRNAFVLSAFDKHISKFLVWKEPHPILQMRILRHRSFMTCQNYAHFQGQEFKSNTLQHCSHLQGFFIPYNIYYCRREHWMIKSRLRKVELTQPAGARVKSILFSVMKSCPTLL